MCSLVDSHEECLVDVYDTYKRQKLKQIVSDYEGTTHFIISYKKVNNAFSKAMYELKKEEYISKHGNIWVDERKLIHATSVDKVLGIIRDNFDWRRVVRSKYGIGVSFSGDADYANCHCNRGNGPDRAFIIAKVLTAEMCPGYQGLIIPSSDYDTSTGAHVYVKYRDNEFLPKYVLYYNCESVWSSKYY